MKKIFIFAVVLFFGITSAASAIPVEVTYTADNVVNSWYQNGGSPIAQAVGPNAGNWQNADTFTIDLAPGSTYQLVWEVSNIGGTSGGNPAAFLAQIDLGDSLIVSSSSFLWDDAGDVTDFNDSTWNWEATTEYGTNGGANIWNSVNGGPVAGIDISALWIWSDTNFAQLEQSHIFIMAEFEIAPVPEPMTILLLGTGLVGLAGAGRKKYFKKS